MNNHRMKKRLLKLLKGLLFLLIYEEAILENESG